MIGVINYGAGNLGSVMNALLRLGAEARFAASPEELDPAVSPFDKLIFPGDGHFAAAMARLNETGYGGAIKRWIAADKQFLGICLGLQLLFEASEEAPGVAGLGILEGCVKLFTAKKVPHIGWNQTRFVQNQLDGKPPPADFYYYIHSYYACPKDKTVIAAVSDYEIEFCAAVRRGRLFAMQFHPEKSGEAGLRLLREALT